MDFSTLIYEKESGVHKITLNRPEKLNSFNTVMRKELDQLINQIAQDSTARVILITGNGSSFCSGADISEFVSGKLGKDAAGTLIMRKLIRTLETCPQPVIAAINGYCLGGGLEISLACDFRIASEKAEFGLTETNLGAIPGAGGTQRLPRIVGIAKAKEMIYLGKRLTAQEALNIGLVSSVTKPEDLLAEANALAMDLSSRAPISLAMAKAAINKVWEFTDIDSGTLWERDYANICSESLDRQEGMKAFVEKRKPVFRGR